MVWWDSGGGGALAGSVIVTTTLTEMSGRDRLVRGIKPVSE